MADIAKRDPLHVRAEIAGPDEFEIGVLDRDVVAHRAFRQQHHARRPLFGDIGGYRRRGAGEISLGQHLRRTFRMREHDDARMIFAQLPHFLGAEALMHLAMPGPGDHLDLGLGGNVPGEIFVGQHDDALDAERLDHGPRIARRAADVGFGLHRGRRVHVSDDRDPGIALPQQPDVFGRDRIRQRTAGAAIRDQHRLGRIEQFGGLGHEVNAGEHDDIGFDMHRLARQSETVADDVGHAVEDLGRLVVMREDDGVAVPLQREDRVDIACEGRPFDRGDRMTYFCVELI